MKNIGLVIMTILIIGTALLGACSLFEKPDSGLYPATQEGQSTNTIQISQTPQHILSLLPDGAENIKVIDSYDGYPDDCWIQFTLNNRWFIFGVHSQSYGVFGTCITEISY